MQLARGGPDGPGPGPANGVAYLSQTTLSVDETNEVIDVLRERFPAIQGPPRDDICYATQNRQEAVKDLAAQVGRDPGDRLGQLVELQAVWSRWPGRWGRPPT